MLEAKLRQNAPHRHIPGSAQRRVYNLQVVSDLRDHIGMDYLLLQLSHVLVINFLADHPVQPLRLRVRLGHGLDSAVVLDALNLLNDLLILGRRHLRAVLPIYLIAVVLGRIVACRHHDARGAA